MRGVLGLAAVMLGAACAGRRGRRRCRLPLERLELAGLAGAPGGGMVVNVHTNLVRRSTHTRSTHFAMQPWDVLGDPERLPDEPDRTGTALAFPTATLDTNARGNGQADAKFTPRTSLDFAG